MHCGIDPALYDRSPSGPGAQLLFVGRLAAVKGVPVLFRALTQVASQFSEVKLTLIGDGPERAGLEAEAHAMGLGGMVHFAGYRSQIEVAEALVGADVLVLPSFAEGLPVVLMEAMAARLPVVTTRIAGVPELVEHGISGLLVSPGDANALAEAITRLLGDAALRAQIGAAGRVKVLAEFDIAQEAAWLGRLLQTPRATDPRPGLRPRGECHMNKSLLRVLIGGRAMSSRVAKPPNAKAPVHCGSHLALLPAYQPRSGLQARCRRSGDAG